MAITILNTPTSPNVTHTRLMYSISSTNVSEPQFQYVADVYDGATQLTRLLIYPNPQGSGIVDISRILSDNLEFDNDWKTANGIAAVDSFKDFDIKFGESFATSISSSATITPNLATSSIYAFPGTVDPNQGSFNWQDSGSLFFLTNQVEGYISKGNYLTVSAYEPANDSTNYVIVFADATGSVLQSTTLGGGTGPNPFVINLPLGSGSAAFGNTFENTDWETITITVGGNVITRYNRVRPCFDEGVTFAFINNYGYYDYYTSDKPVREVTDVERNIYKRTNVDYSSTTSLYDITRRGAEQYNTGYNDRYQVTTALLDKDEASWLTELLDSPEVYIQEDGNFIPIVITNSTYTHNTNQARQKVFQYTIEYYYANQRYGR